MPDPWLDPVKTAEVASEYGLRLAAHDGIRIALQLAADRNDIAADFGMRSELDIAEDGHGVAVDFAIDVYITENRDGAVGQRAGNMC